MVGIVGDGVVGAGDKVRRARFEHHVGRHNIREDTLAIMMGSPSVNSMLR